MSTTDLICPDLKAVLRRLKLSPILHTLPERLTLARQQKMPHQDFFLLVLADEVARRDSTSAALRASRALLAEPGLIPKVRGRANRSVRRAASVALGRCRCR